MDYKQKIVQLENESYLRLELKDLIRLG